MHLNQNTMIKLVILVKYETNYANVKRCLLRITKPN